MVGDVWARRVPRLRTPVLELHICVMLDDQVLGELIVPGLATRLQQHVVHYTQRVDGPVQAG
eukprot:COSAG03_NODE_2769_length_2462_cov_1.853153_2_plen_62_part_00